MPPAATTRYGSRAAPQISGLPALTRQVPPGDGGYKIAGPRRVRLPCGGVKLITDPGDPRREVQWWIVNIPAFIGFWWFTMWFLLAGRAAWRTLYPCAVTTGAFWIGMLVVFHFIFSGMVISYDQKYGPIGVVFGLMSYFIAIGVVITLGAAVGLMWQDRGLSFGAAVRKLRRAS